MTCQPAGKKNEYQVMPKVSGLGFGWYIQLGEGGGFLVQKKFPQTQTLWYVPPKTNTFLTSPLSEQIPECPVEFLLGAAARGHVDRQQEFLRRVILKRSATNQIDLEALSLIILLE